MKIKIYVEGGGDSSALKTKCRQGFRRFFENAGLSGKMPAIVACGSRGNAYDSFRTAIASAGQNELPLLLVDSEDPVSESPWKHLTSRDGWDKTDDVEDKHAHLMVQSMESWFLADRKCLSDFFGQGFSEKALPGNKKIETIAKIAVLQSLKKASKKCKPKGEYGKGKHSFDILGRLDPAKVRSAAPHAERLLRLLESS